LYFPGGRDAYYRVGAFDLGEENGLIAQFGTKLNDTLGLRYGLYDDKLGVGLDYMAPSGYPRITLDAYRPNDPHWDLRFWHSISRDWSLLFGVNDLGQGNSPLVGLAYGGAPRAARQAAKTSATEGGK